MIKPALVATALVAALWCAPAARAAFVIDFGQVGSGVVATGSGSFDLTDLTNYNFSPWTNSGWIAPGSYDIIGTGSIDAWGGFTGPSAFGSTAVAGGPASSNTGELVGIAPSFPALYIPTSYVSGNSFSSSSTWDATSLADLGLTPGTYVWSWGSGANADSFTINVVPEPASFALLAPGLLGLGLAVGQRRKAG